MVDGLDGNDEILIHWYRGGLLRLYRPGGAARLMTNGFRDRSDLKIHHRFY